MGCGPPSRLADVVPGTKVKICCCKTQNNLFGQIDGKILNSYVHGQIVTVVSDWDTCVGKMGFRVDLLSIEDEEAREVLQQAHANGDTFSGHNLDSFGLSYDNMVLESEELPADDRVGRYETQAASGRITPDHGSSSEGWNYQGGRLTPISGSSSDGYIISGGKITPISGSSSDGWIYQGGRLTSIGGSSSDGWTGNAPIEVMALVAILGKR